jgi:hypothetical protein
MATFCFFGGMACIAALNWVVHLLEKLANPPPPRASIELATATPVTSGASVKANAPEEDIGDVSINGSVVLSVTPDAESSRRCLSNEAVRMEAGARTGDTELTVPDNVKEIMDRDDHHAGLNKMGEPESPELIVLYFILTLFFWNTLFNPRLKLCSCMSLHLSEISFETLPQIQ